jgi:hypothetical protein
MAEKNNDDHVVKSNLPAPQFTTEQLLAMLIASQKDNAESNKKLAEAILEGRKPYIDPKVLAAKQAELEERAKAVAIEANTRAFNKANCSHLRDIDNTSNIKWMEHSNGIILGVCGNCHSQFDARQPKDYALLRGDAKAARNMGRAGQHAQNRRIGHA